MKKTLLYTLGVGEEGHEFDGDLGGPMAYTVGVEVGGRGFDSR